MALYGGPCEVCLKRAASRTGVVYKERRPVYHVKTCGDRTCLAKMRARYEEEHPDKELVVVIEAPSRTGRTAIENANPERYLQAPKGASGTPPLHVPSSKGSRRTKCGITAPASWRLTAPRFHDATKCRACAYPPAQAALATFAPEKKPRRPAFLHTDPDTLEMQRRLRGVLDPTRRFRGEQMRLFNPRRKLTPAELGRLVVTMERALQQRLGGWEAAHELAEQHLGPGGTSASFTTRQAMRYLRAGNAVLDSVPPSERERASWPVAYRQNPGRSSREKKTGRYSYQNKWERLCVCGRTLGVHDAEPPHAFGDLGLDPREGLPDCDRFRPAKKQNPRASSAKLGRPTWLPLFVDGETNPAVRDGLRGRACVYLLRPGPKKPIRYVGSSEPGTAPRGAYGTRKRKRAEADPLRAWKTITRHFHACTSTRAKGRKRGQASAYSFGLDNFCTEAGRESWQVAVFLCPPSAARDLELAAIDRFKPTYQAEHPTSTQAIDDSPPAWDQPEDAFGDLLR